MRQICAIKDKKELRLKVRKKIKELDENYINLSDKGIYENLISVPEYIKASTVFLYCSTDREPNTFLIIEDAIKNKKRVFLPISYSDGRMALSEIDDISELTPGKYGILEPKQERICDIIPDVCVVPALAYDKMGYRLGHGGGYYDRYLKDCNTYKIGLCRAKMVYSKLPTEEFDVPVNCLVTEKEIARLN